MHKLQSYVQGSLTDMHHNKLEKVLLLLQDEKIQDVTLQYGEFMGTHTELSAVQFYFI